MSRWKKQAKEPPGPDLFSIGQARAERDEALAAVEDAADDGWKSRAWAWLLEYLKRNELFFPDDCWAAGLEPPKERRVLGALVLRASKEGLIVKTDVRRQRTLGHAAEAVVWRSTLWQGAAAGGE